MNARSLVVAELEMATAALVTKSVPPLNSANSVKFVLSRLGITESVRLAKPTAPSVRKHVPDRQSPPASNWC